MHPIAIIALTVWWIFPALTVIGFAIAYAVPHRTNRHGSVH